MFLRALLAIAALSPLAVPSFAQSAAPNCAGEVEIDRARIVRVEHNGVLVLQDGRAASLEGIRIPLAAPDRAPKPIADQAYDALNSACEGPGPIASRRVAQRRPL